MTSLPKHKIKLREVNRHLVCRLCRGYYVDATTIAECLHSFCRSCIIKNLEKNSFCPICEVQIHKTKPYLNLRLDKALQDVVYKLVPGLYHAEMARRRAFYENRPDQLPLTTPEQRGVEERLIFSPEDSISLSLEYMDCPEPESESISSRSSESGEDFPLQLGLMKVRRGDSTTRKESVDSNEPGMYPMRYLLCPAVVSVSILKKFIAMKFDLSPKIQVEVIHKRVSLPDHYTLMDLAYIFTWKRMAPMRLFYKIYQMEREKVSIVPTTVSHQQDLVKPLPTLLENKKENVIPATLKKPLTVLTPRKSEPSRKEENPSSNKLEPKNIVNNEKKDKSVAPSPKSTDVLHGNKPYKCPYPTEPKTPNKSVEPKVAEIMNKKQKESIVKEKAPVGHENVNCTEIKKKDTPTALNSETDKKEIVNNVNKLNKPPKESTLKFCKDTSAKKLPSLQKQPLSSSGNSNVEPKLAPKFNVAQSLDSIKMKPPTVVRKDDNKLDILNPKMTEVKPRNIPSDSKPPSKPIIPEGHSETTDSKPAVKYLLNPASGQLEAVPASPEKEEIKEKLNVIHSDNKIEKSASAKSSVQQLKTFRIDKSNISTYRIDKTNISKPLTKGSNAVTISPIPKKEKAAPKCEINVSIELRTDKEEACEYDFESSSPPNKIMSLHEYTQSEMYKSKFPKENGTGPMNLKEVINGKIAAKRQNGEVIQSKKRVVPLLHRIHSEKKFADGKKESNAPRVINIQTPPESKGSSSPPKPIKIENKGGEYSIKQPLGDAEKRVKSEGIQEESSELLRSLLKRKGNQNMPIAKEKGNPSSKKRKLPPGSSPVPIKPSTPVDLSKADSGTSANVKGPVEKLMDVSKNPLENLMDMAKKQGDKKDPNNMLEVLISIAQKQSIEPLLKVPQYPPVSGGATSQTVTPTSINYALQFFQKLSSEMEQRSQAEQTVPPKMPNFATFQHFYQQQIEFVRHLKRQQASLNSDIAAKVPKLSPGKDGKNSPVKDDSVLKNVERTLSQIQQQAEIQSRLAAAQTLKNMPNLLPYYSHPGAPAFRQSKSPPAPSLSPGQSLKASQLSPHGQKSPTEQQQIFAAQQQQLFNAGLTSEMSFHQMFQQYLQQQLKMNQRKPTDVKTSPPLPHSRTSPTPPEKVSPSHASSSPKLPTEVSPPTKPPTPKPTKV